MSSGVLSVDVAPQPDGSWVVTSVAAAADFGQHAPRAAANVRVLNLHDIFLPIRTSLERSSEADSQLQAFIRTLPSPAPPRQQHEGEIVADVTAAVVGGGGAGGGSGGGCAGSARYGGDTGTVTTAGNGDDDETVAPPDGEDSVGVAARVTTVEETVDDRRVGQRGEDEGEGSRREGHFDSWMASPPPLRDLPPHLLNNLNTELQPGFGFGFRGTGGGAGGGGGGATCMIPETEFSPEECDDDENVGRGGGIVGGLPWTSLDVGSLPVAMDDNDDDDDDKEFQGPPPRPQQGDRVDALATVPLSLAAAGAAATGIEAAATGIEAANGGRQSINTPLFGDDSECHDMEGAAMATEMNERDGERGRGGGVGGGGGGAGAGGIGAQTSPVVFVPETEGLDYLGVVEDVGNIVGIVGGVGGFEDVAGVSGFAAAPPGSAWKTPAPRPRHGGGVSGAEVEVEVEYSGVVGVGVGGICTNGNPSHAPVSFLPPHIRGTAAGGSAGWNGPGGGGPGAARGSPLVRRWSHS